MHPKTERNSFSRISDVMDFSIALSSCSASSCLWKLSLTVLFCSKCSFSCWWPMSSFSNACLASSWALIASLFIVWNCFTSMMSACAVIWWGAGTSLTLPPAFSTNNRVTFYLSFRWYSENKFRIALYLANDGTEYRKVKYSSLCKLCKYVHSLLHELFNTVYSKLTLNKWSRDTKPSLDQPYSQ